MTATLANWRAAPYNRWAFHHVRELIPSAEIANDPGKVRPLPPAPAQVLEESFLAETDTDAVAVLHRGRLIFERYFNGMSARSQHILMSVSKSMLGLLILQLKLDPAREITHWVPELEATAYRG